MIKVKVEFEVTIDETISGNGIPSAEWIRAAVEEGFKDYLAKARGEFLGEIKIVDVQ